MYTYLDRKYKLVLSGCLTENRFTDEKHFIVHYSLFYKHQTNILQTAAIFPISFPRLHFAACSLPQARCWLCVVCNLYLQHSDPDEEKIMDLETLENKIM